MKSAVCLLLAIASTAAGAPAGPGKAAIDFLEKVRQRQLDLEPGGDTALSPHTGEEKRERIARRLERLAVDLGEAPLEIGAVKQDAGFAAVLVRKIGGYDPSSLQVFAIALVKRGAEWMAAPVPASFENSGTAYASSLRDRLIALEDWMMREQVSDLQQLRKDAFSRMRLQIESRLSAETLRELSAEQAVEAFLVATSQRDLPSLLGLLGGHSAEPLVDWPQRLRAAENAVAGELEVGSPWRWLITNSILRKIVRVEEGDVEALITVAFLDPVGQNANSPSATFELLSLALEKDADGLWRIAPPVAAPPDSQKVGKNRATDSDMLDAFPQAWREAHPAVPQPDSERLAVALEKALHHDDLPTLLNLLALPEKPADARRVFLEAANFWQSFRETRSVQQAVPLALKTETIAAAALYQLFSSRDPDLFTPKSVLFEKSAEGWLWSLRPDPGLRAGFRDWLASEIAVHKSGWRAQFLAGVPTVTDVADQGAPPEEASVECVRKWLDSTRRRDVAATLASMARQSNERSETAALKNLGYELDGARLRADPAQILGTYRDGPWTGVGVKIPMTSGKKVSHPFFAVVRTPVGPRVLAEIDLFGGGDHTRDFLNDNAFSQLEQTAGKPATDQLRTLFARFEEDLRSRDEASPELPEAGN